MYVMLHGGVVSCRPKGRTCNQVFVFSQGLRVQFLRLTGLGAAVHCVLGAFVQRFGGGLLTTPSFNKIGLGLLCKKCCWIQHKSGELIRFYKSRPTAVYTKES